MTSPMRQTAGSLRAKLTPAGVPEALPIGLSAAILAVRGGEPVVAVVPASRTERPGDGVLPGGFFCPSEHTSLESGVCALVRAATGLKLKSTQQLATFGHRGGGLERDDAFAVSVCFLAVVGPSQCAGSTGVEWQSWYTYLPWEDWRHGKPASLQSEIEPRLAAWGREGASTSELEARSAERDFQIRVCFGGEPGGWDEEKALERYELLCEAGILAETPGLGPASWLARLHHPEQGDQGRMLASAVGALRQAIKSRPVLFELMDDEFTLFELQKTVEAILGPHLHKQNFRRLVESAGLVEPTGQLRFRTGGRPAQLYRFRRGVLLERLAAGVRVRPGLAKVGHAGVAR
jgi:hypothetical protein